MKFSVNYNNNNFRIIIGLEPSKPTNNNKYYLDLSRTQNLIRGDDIMSPLVGLFIIVSLFGLLIIALEINQRRRSCKKSQDFYDFLMNQFYKECDFYCFLTEEYNYEIATKDYFTEDIIQKITETTELFKAMFHDVNEKIKETGENLEAISTGIIDQKLDCIKGWLIKIIHSKKS